MFFIFLSLNSFLIFSFFLMLPSISLSTLLAIFVGRAFSQDTGVTLWQFGTLRLAAGEFTAPLRPIGTPVDGLSTTYLYEVLNPVTTVVTDAGSPELTTSVVSVSRTIVASASGWVENFDSTATVQCNFISSDTGECFDATNTITAAPTPIVIGVAAAITSTPTEITTTFLSSTLTIPATSNSKPIISPTGSISTSPSGSRKSSIGAIVGGTIAGVLVAGLFVILIFWLLRRQRRSDSLDAEKGKGSTPLPYTLTAPTRTKDLPSLPSQPSIFPSGQTSTGSSPSKITNKYDLGDSNGTQLRQQAQGAREELLSLQQASSDEDNSHEAVTNLRGRMAEVLERLGRLEEQTSGDEPPPSYV
ncbi:hypothetical protein F5890DRAFT_1510158 [Lentinula detonsa]|uniref:Mid2 domain-containing protein n=1 Tax=Lentinula detonsa TaxID=2804962 RepID=A0AA38Q243_9AGAR|nr:hypothetical protein F5890DRAFT_1510158 [Lentinula detonsa]